VERRDHDLADGPGRIELGEHLAPEPRLAPDVVADAEHRDVQLLPRPRHGLIAEMLEEDAARLRVDDEPGREQVQRLTAERLRHAPDGILGRSAEAAAG